MLIKNFPKEINPNEKKEIAHTNHREKTLKDKIINGTIKVYLDFF